MSRTARASEHAGGLRCSFCRAELPVLGLQCSWGALCPPHSRAWAGTGSCSTAASRGNGLRNPREANRCGSTGGFTPSCRRPPLPQRCPAEISSQLAGLDGKRPRVPSTAGPPGSRGETGTAAAPALPPCPTARAAPQCRGPALHCCSMCWQPCGKARAVWRRKGTAATLHLPAPYLPLPSPVGMMTWLPRGPCHPVLVLPEPAPSPQPFPPQLPARLTLSQVRGMKGGPWERWWQHEGHAASRRHSLMLLPRAACGGCGAAWGDPCAGVSGPWPAAAPVASAQRAGGGAGERIPDPQPSLASSPASRCRNSCHNRIGLNRAALAPGGRGEIIGMGSRKSKAKKFLLS